MLQAVAWPSATIALRLAGIPAQATRPTKLRRSEAGRARTPRMYRK